MNVYTVVVKNCVKSSYYDAEQIFPFIFIKIFFLTTLLRKRFTLFLKQTSKTPDVAASVVQEWKNGLLLRLNLYTSKAWNSIAQFLS